MVKLGKVALNRNLYQNRGALWWKKWTKIAIVNQMTMMRFQMETRTSCRTSKMSSTNNKMVLKNLRVFCDLQRSRAPGPPRIPSSWKKMIGFRKCKGLIL